MRLTVEGLAGERGGETVFSDVSFDLSSGDALVITGPNGAGKSTLLRVLAGLLGDAGGTIAYENDDPEFPDFRSALHFLGHANGMKSNLSVEENLRFWQSFNGNAHLDLADALEIVGLPAVAHLPFGYLSTGQKRRISIARLLVSYRPIWLLDEPTSGLDKASEAQFADLMNAHREEGGIVIAATHLPLGLDGVKTLVLGQRP